MRTASAATMTPLSCRHVTAINNTYRGSRHRHILNLWYIFLLFLWLCRLLIVVYRIPVTWPAQPHHRWSMVILDPQDAFQAITPLGSCYHHRHNCAQRQREWWGSTGARDAIRLEPQVCFIWYFYSLTNIYSYVRLLLHITMTTRMVRLTLFPPQAHHFQPAAPCFHPARMCFHSPARVFRHRHPLARHF